MACVQGIIKIFFIIGALHIEIGTSLVLTKIRVQCVPKLNTITSIYTYTLYNIYIYVRNIANRGIYFPIRLLRLLFASHKHTNTTNSYHFSGTLKI